MAPVVTGVEWARQRSSVVLPAPDLPMTATNSPGRIVVVTFSRARLRAKHFVTWCNVIIGDIDIGGVLYLGRELHRIDALSPKIIKGDRHHVALAVDLGHAEELQASGWRGVRLGPFGDAVELDLQPEGIVDRVRPEGAGVQRT